MTNLLPGVLTPWASARAIALAIPAGESPSDHQMRERAWVSVLFAAPELMPEWREFALARTT